MWTFWKDKEDFIYLLPLVAYYCDRQCLMFKFGWLKWRCGFYKGKGGKEMKKYLPIKVHHIYFGYGWWWGSKVYFRDRIHGGIFIVPLEKECPIMVYAHNGKAIGYGRVMSWEQSRQREAYGN